MQPNFFPVKEVLGQLNGNISGRSSKLLASHGRRSNGITIENLYINVSKTPRRCVLLKKEDKRSIECAIGDLVYTCSALAQTEDYKRLFVDKYRDIDSNRSSLFQCDGWLA